MKTFDLFMRRICFGVYKGNKNDKNNFKTELNKLWIHGLLHLLGYDHKSNSQYLQMQKLEKKFSYLIK